MATVTPCVQVNISVLGTGAGSETSGSAGKRMGDSRGTADSGGKDQRLYC